MLLNPGMVSLLREFECQRPQGNYLDTLQQEICTSKQLWPSHTCLQGQLIVQTQHPVKLIIPASTTQPWFSLQGRLQLCS